MLCEEVLERFLDESPLCVMSRGVLENFLPAQTVDQLFEQTAQQQYTRELLFSSCVDLMALVVGRMYGSVKAAYLKRREQLGVTLKCLYEKLQRTEPRLCSALVRLTADKAQAVLAALGREDQPLLPGYRLKVVDGNHLAASQRRLKELRGHSAAPLPGLTLPVYDPDLGLVTEVLLCEDGHAQERSLQGEVLALVQPGEVWVADRNFCLIDLLRGVAQRGAFFVVRWHEQVTVQPQEKYSAEVETETGWVSECRAQVLRDGQVELEVRLLRVRLKQPTQEGDSEIYLLTNLPAAVRTTHVAAVYLKRWTIEVAFGELTVNLKCEVNTLAYPKAALFGFCVALVMYNVLAVVKRAVAARQGRATVQEELSSYYLAEEVAGVYRGMMIALPTACWVEVQALSAKELAELLRGWAARVDLRRYAKSHRPPKKRVERINDGTPHVSTARILARRKQTGGAEVLPEVPPNAP